jgi:hypothetical protein
MTFKGQVSKFQSFKVSMLNQGACFKVSKFQSFNVNRGFNVGKRFFRFFEQ